MKLRKKLLLSCAALAACATTMVSTTYAWYVVNPTAEATGMTASTTKSSGDASIYVSEDGSVFSKSVEITDQDYLLNGTFDPITTEDGLKFKTVEEKDVTDATPKRIQFAIWVKSDNNATVTPKFTVTNSTTTYTKQTAYQTITKDDATNKATSGSEFFVDAVQALRMSVTNVTANDIATAKTAAAAATTATIYDVQSIHKGASDAAYVPATGSITDDDINLNAHQYYNAIMGTNPADTTPATAQTAWSTFELTANTAQCFVFTIWLEGADTLCFDSCVGQNFTFAISFTAKSKAVTTA